MNTNQFAAKNNNQMTAGESLAEDVIEGVLEVGAEVAPDGLEGVGDAVGDAIGGVLEGIDDLPVLAVVGIIAGAVVALGGIVFGIYKLVKKAVNK